MKAYIWTIIIMMALESYLSVLAIARQDYQRNPEDMAGGVGISLVLIAWGAWLLGVSNT